MLHHETPVNKRQIALTAGFVGYMVFIYNGTMKKNKLYLTTFLTLIIPIILYVITPKHKIEEIALIFLILFSITAILISASLTSFTKSIVKKSLYNIPFVLLFGFSSCCIYFTMFLFTFSDLEGGESGMVFGGIFGVLGSIVVGIISIIINFLILIKKRV